VRSLLAAAPTKLTVVPSHELTHVVQQRPAAVARRPFDAVIRRVQWTDANVTLTANLSAELRDGLAQAMANPAALPAGPQWLRNRLIQEDNLDLAAKAAGTSYADNANEAWNRLKPPAQARLVEATFKTQNVQKAQATALAGQNTRVKAMMTQRLSGTAPDGKVMIAGKFKWAEVFKNKDGDLPGVAGAGGYDEYYAEPDPGDLPADGFWGRNRILHNVTVGSPHSGHWWVTADHYEHYVKVTDA